MISKKLILTLITLVGADFNSAIAAPSTEKQVAGKAIMARGQVQAVNPIDNSERKIRRRAQVFDIENIKTGKKGVAQFSMVDGGLLSVKPNSEVRIAEYSFDSTTNDGTASIELIKGGLRSISGKIKKHGGDFDVKTPVGSIGIRGTHFELEMLEGQLFIAVWDGAIDITTDDQVVSFGSDESYSYGVVSLDGQITQLLQAPANFQSGHTSSEEADESEGSDDNEDTEGSDDNQDTEGSDDNDDAESSDDNENSEDDAVSDSSDNTLVAADSSEGEETEETNLNVVTEADSTDLDNTITNLNDSAAGDTESLYVEQEVVSENTEDLAEIVATRQGVFTYSNLRTSQLTSTEGAITNFSMSMTVDFDNGFVPQGELSATDEGGEWYASFSGFINVTELDLEVTFASYNDLLAEGMIDAEFFDSADAILGRFELNEILNPNKKIIGSFILD